MGIIENIDTWLKLLELSAAGAVAIYLMVAAKLKLSDERRAFVARALDVGYGFVNEVARLTPNTIDDKFALFLKAANEHLRAQGKRELSPSEVEAAKLAVKARHGDESKVLGALGAIGSLASLPAPNPLAVVIPKGTTDHP